MFRCLRIQILQPCQGRCRWCATHKKNPLFLKLQKSGDAGRVHDFYARAAERFRPAELYVSGGEPLLMDGIGRLMARMAPFVKRIHLFTSYQFTDKRVRRLDLDSMPWDKVVLTHTILYFRKPQWEALSRKFPFDVYVGNLKELAKLPWRKCYKFIVNHSDSERELDAFLETVRPDHQSTIRWKLMNQQASNRFNIEEITRTRREVLSHISRWQERMQRFGGASDSAGVNMDQSLTGLEVLDGLSRSDSVKSCPYRSDPEELRFAFYKAKGKKLVLKYRFCPHFPSDFGYLHEVGRSPLKQIREAFEKRKYTEHCGKCRLQLYVDNQAG